MLLSVLVFIVATGGLIAAYYAATELPGYLAARRVDRRLRDVTMDVAEPSSLDADSTVVKKAVSGRMAAIDRLVSGTRVGVGLTRLIEQSGARVTPGAILIMSLGSAAVCGLAMRTFVRNPFAGPIGLVAGALVPFFWLLRRRSARFSRFEEQFPEALDLLSRAIRAGHAFQTAMGMVADEMPEPVGPEFKKTFDQQNYGLPLREALNELADRLKLIDVRFFVTAVLIQRDTGGNLSEILDNLAHVVRERFKIKRQVRVHTAHGRFTGWVLLALPAFLALALSFINPDHMHALFHERLGQQMLMAAIVMQAIGYFWIRQVIKIEV
jgi:tight adherence protein B